MLNKILLHGRLTADPELRQVGADCLSLCRFPVAVDRPYSKGETKADFIQCQAWRQTADFIGKYFSKGKFIIVEGMLNNNDFTDKDGVKHYGYVVAVQNVSFGESKNSGGGNQNMSRPVIDNEDVPLDDLSEFEEILSDGDVPF